MSNNPADEFKSLAENLGYPVDADAVNQWREWLDMPPVTSRKDIEKLRDQTLRKNHGKRECIIGIDLSHSDSWSGASLIFQKIPSEDLARQYVANFKSNQSVKTVCLFWEGRRIYPHLS